MEEIIVTLKSLRWEDPNSDFAFGEGITQSGNTVSIKGDLQKLIMNSEYILKGTFEESKGGFPPTFAIDKLTTPVVNTRGKKAITNFLTSSHFPGVGIRTVEKIFNELGDNAVEVLINDINALDNVKINKTMKNTIRLGFATHEITLGLRNKIGCYNPNITEADLKSIEYHARGAVDRISYESDRDKTDVSGNVLESVITAILEDPYQVYGLSFATADILYLNYAKKHNLRAYTTGRLRSAMRYTVKDVMQESMNSASSGHTVFNINNIYSTFKSVLKDPFLENDVWFEALDASLNGKRPILHKLDETYYMLKTDVKCEKEIAKRLATFITKEVELIDDNKLSHIIETIEMDQGYPYDVTQVEAIKSAFGQKVSIVTGGPGTGKTTTVNGIIAAYREVFNICEREIKLMAPTGKAARRVQAQTGLEAGTIHKTLEYKGHGVPVEYNMENPLPAKLVVIDESSMIDEELFRITLNAISDDASIIIVGDVDQLECMGVGAVLNDIINSNLVNTVKLTKVFRQGEDSDIINLGIAVNTGAPIDFTNKRDVKFMHVVDPRLVDQVAGKALAELSKDNDPMQIQMLSPTNATVNTINEAMQKANSSEKIVYVDNQPFKVGDKVMATKNDYDSNLRNGDIGRVEYIATDKRGEVKSADIEFDHKTFITKNHSDTKLRLGYACTIHKSQGSEWDNIILVLKSSDSFTLNRKLVYTAITRAKKSITIIGDLNTLAIAGQNEPAPRFTALIHFMQEAIDEIKDERALAIV